MLDFLETQHLWIRQQIQFYSKKYDKEVLKLRPDFAKMMIDAGLEAELVKVKEWAETHKQPSGAVISHFGINRSFGTCHAQFEAPSHRLSLSLPEDFGKQGTALFLWKKNEVDRLAVIVKRVFGHYHEIWNEGSDCVGFRVKLRPSKGVMDCLKNYSKGGMSISQSKYDLAKLPEGWH